MTSLAADYPLEIEQGATYDKTFTWYDADGIARDLTGATATFAIYSDRRTAGAGGAALLSITPTLGGTAGTLRVQMTASQTAALAFLTAYYQLKVTLADTTVHRVAAGTATLSRGA